VNKNVWDYVPEAPNGKQIMALIEEQRTAEKAGPVIIERPMTGPTVWRAKDVIHGGWRVPITEDALAELDTMASALARYDDSIEDLRPDAFDWPATTEIMVDIQSRLNQGIGFAVLDGLPVERWGGNGESGDRVASYKLSGACHQSEVEGRPGV